MTRLSAEMPTCLWFSKQDSLCIWDEEVVLDTLAEWLEKEGHSFQRHPKEETLGHLDIYCSNHDLSVKLRAKYQELRVTV